MSNIPALSKPSDASGGMRPKGWRKPVPKLIPDPPKRHHTLSRSSSFRHLTLLPSNEPQPPMPDNWRENIDRAVGKVYRVERPSSPTPPNGSHTDVSASECGVVSRDVTSSTRRRGSRGEEKALPTLPDTRGTQRLSDAVSTLTESTTSTSVEPSADHPMDASTRPSSSKNDQAAVLLQTPPPAPEPERAHVADDRQFYGPSDAQYRIVYPQGLNCSKLDVTRRHVAVFPILPRNTTDRDNMSAELTAFETLEDARSVRHPYTSSVMLDKMVRAQDRPCSTGTNYGCMQCGHIFRGFVRRRARSTTRVNC
ncbi:hypothetical protein BC835DRAFT_24126 [Cytidiella melzeri]|nr:hypothetical protein BC835DRAFT_24126 [Cytidiella melzeri]